MSIHPVRSASCGYCEEGFRGTQPDHSIAYCTRTWIFPSVSMGETNKMEDIKHRGRAACCYCPPPFAISLRRWDGNGKNGIRQAERSAEIFLFPSPLRPHRLPCSLYLSLLMRSVRMSFTFTLRRKLFYVGSMAMT